jgi:hypothetical protein
LVLNTFHDLKTEAGLRERGREKKNTEKRPCEKSRRKLENTEIEEI